MSDLFTYAAAQPRYPSTPGHRGGGTSAAAAESMERAAPVLRQRCLDRLRLGPATADEIAAWLDQSVLSIRPRITELFQMGEIEDTGERRPNASQRRAKVWQVAS
jgi:hypothetical protein